MVREQRKAGYRLLFCWILSLALAGCAVFGPRPAVPTPLPRTSTPAPTATPPIPLPTDTPIPTPLGGHAEHGPWLLVANKKGVETFNPDGSGKTVFLVGNLLWGLPDVRGGTMPGGDWLALRTAGDPLAFADMELILVHLPDGAVHHVAPLLSTRVDQAASSSIAEPARDAAAAAGVLHWSPNGRYLTFVAALEGPTADLYLFDAQTSTIRRLSAGPFHAYPLAWTPDSRFVIFAETRGCPVSGCSFDSVWIAPADFGSPRRLYNAQSSLGETVIGFWGPDQMIVAAVDPLGGNNIRRVDLNSGGQFTLFPGHIFSVAFDPLGLSILWAAPPSLNVNGRAYLPAGVGILNASKTINPFFRFLTPGDWRQAAWLPETGQFALGDGQKDPALLVGADGKMVTYAMENWSKHPPEPAPDGSLIAFFGDSLVHGETSGVRLYDPAGGLAQDLTPLPVQSLAWRPDGKGLFFVSGSTLYLQAVGSSSPAVIDEDIELGGSGGLIWVKGAP